MFTKARARVVLAAASVGATRLTPARPGAERPGRAHRRPAWSPIVGATLIDGNGGAVSDAVADLLPFTADPAADIHHLRKLETVMRDGAVIDIKALPTKPVWVKR